MTVKTTKLSKQGQITLPKKFIQMAGLVNGEILNIEISNDGSIIIRKKPDVMNKYIGALNGIVDITTEEYLKTKKKEARL